MSSAVHLSASSAQHVAAYLEYERIVGDDDGGRLFTEAEYEEYKANVATARLQRRLYVSWRSVDTGMDCRQIGPSSTCFCTHRYRQHDTDRCDDRQVRCKVKGCPCPLFDYLPIRGTQDVKCSACKHSHDTHNARDRRCRHSSTASTSLVRSSPARKPPLATAASSSSSSNCSSSSSSSSSTSLISAPSRSSFRLSSSFSSCECPGFTTSLSCSCKAPWSAHRTVFESREERERAGRPVDRYGGTMYKGMGGLTGFTSLVDGVDLAQVEGQQRAVMGNGARGQRVLMEDNRGSAAIALVAGDEVREAQLRRGKMQEKDEMALYEQKYHRTMSTRSRTGLRPATPKVEEERASSSSSFTRPPLPRSSAQPTSTPFATSSRRGSGVGSSTSTTPSSRAAPTSTASTAASSAAPSSPRPSASSTPPRRPSVSAVSARRLSASTSRPSSSSSPPASSSSPSSRALQKRA